MSGDYAPIEGEARSTLALIIARAEQRVADSERVNASPDLDVEKAAA